MRRRSSMIDACHTRPKFESAPLCSDASEFLVARARWLPDRKIALVREICQVALDCGGVAPGFAPSQNMNREHTERQVDEDRSPADVRRVDSEQHRDAEENDARIERGTEQRARSQRRKQAGGLGRAAIERGV